MKCDPAVKWAYALTCATLVVGALGFRAAMAALDVYVRKEAVPLRESLDTLPTTLGRWKAVGEDRRLSAAVVENLGTTQYLDRDYAIDGQPAKGRLQLHIAYYTGTLDTIPHIPERCFTAGGLTQSSPPRVISLAVDRSGWKSQAGPVNRATGTRYDVAKAVDPVTRLGKDVNLPVGDMALTITEFQIPRHKEISVVGGYMFVANGRVTPSALAVKSLSFDLSERYAYYCKVQFTSEFRGGPEGMQQYEANVAELLTDLLPHLMQRLPDWAAVEARTAADGSKQPVNPGT
ncbi:MAG: exosortase-associated EpsI family protein [Phycisphaerales bacterium]